jgi:Spx/MgsR family transcriptional regulator
VVVAEINNLAAMKVYGITNCNTVKKALDWLKQHQVEYEFHDFKKLGIDAGKLEEWDQKAGYEKGLDANTKENITSATEALPLLQQKTSMIKRPVIEDGDFLYFGFNETAYQQHFRK